MNKQGNDALTYDYIVVGTGPAGAVIAKRLTDDKKTSLLVLEAGDNNSGANPIRDSRFAPPVILRDDYSAQYFWQGRGVPQEKVNNRTFEWTGGRTLGGTSSVNNEQYVRPSQANMKQWENLLGPLWSPEQETQKFKKLEKYNGISYNPDARGTNGRLDIRQTPANPTDMTEKLVCAIEEATGLPRILDYNDPKTPLGPFTMWQLYQMPNGIRESADTAFLSPDIMTPDGKGVDGRKLRVSYKSTVFRVIFDKQKRAIGVEFLKKGECVRAYADKKIIVSAGINSPQLLMLSGIGPREVLTESGIPLICHNPNVGRNMTTHCANIITFKTNPNDKSLPENDPFALYTAGAFLPNPTPGSDPSRRGVQLFGISGPDNTLNLAFYLTEPLSRGAIRIQNNDPLKVALADEGLLSDPRDPRDLEAIKNIFKVYIKEIAAKLSNIDPKYQLISPTLETIDDDQKLEMYI